MESWQLAQDGSSAAGRGTRWLRIGLEAAESKREYCDR